MTGSIRKEKTQYKGWNAVVLHNDLISLVAVPDVGGRIMAYNLGPYSYLYNDLSLSGKLFSPEENQGDGSLAAWKNYGGDKTWPSPQGWDNEDQWHGPPDPVLDTGRFTSETGIDDSSTWVRMVSPAGSSTGIQTTRRFTLHPGTSRVQVDLTFTNISQRSVRWSIWDVIQMDASNKQPEGRLTYEPSCALTARLHPNSRFPKGFYVMFGEESNPQWTVDAAKNLFVGRNRWEIGKVGIDTPDGWAAFSNPAQGYAFAERFSYEVEAEYPDAGATVEFWTVGKGRVANLDYEGSDIYLMEVEILSPFYTFAPGQSRTFSIEWGACRCDGMVSGVSEAGCIVQPLTADRLGDDYVRLKGSFGVFDQGVLWLIWKDANGMVIAASERSGVDPLGALIIDRVLQVPPKAVKVSLEVKANANQRTYLLAEADLV